MPSKTFTNERGNKITASATRASKDQITVKLVGPKSTVTNKITDKEGSVLRALMGKVIK